MDFIQLKEKFPGECMESHIARFMAEDVVDFTIQEEVDARLEIYSAGQKNIIRYQSKKKESFI